MSKTGKFSMEELKKLQKQLNALTEKDTNDFVEACAKELAARLLAKVIKRTPVGVYPKSSGKKGGTLRRGWTAETHEEATSGNKVSASQYANSLKINHVGNMLMIEIINPVEYASYVEHGHRTADHEGWVKGQFMLTISEQEIQEIAPKVLEAKIKKFFEGCMK